MKILVAGNEGYIGSLLVPMLIQQKHQVIGLDTGFYRVSQLYEGSKLTVKTLHKDIRHITAEDLLGIEAVVHMGRFSIASSAQIPNGTYNLDYQGSLQLATIAKSAGVRRFVYMSSCNVYGVSTNDYVTEKSPVNPRSPDAVCKTLVERDLRAIADDSFSPTFLRLGTVFGASPQMRFDSILNGLAGLAWTTKKIKVTSDDILWHPLVHVLDVCQAIVSTLEAPRALVHNQTLNVGNTEHNYQVKEIAEVVAEVFKGCQFSFGGKTLQACSYRVSFERINETLPNFKCEWNAQRGAEQLLSLFTLVDISKQLFCLESSVA